MNLLVGMPLKHLVIEESGFLLLLSNKKLQASKDTIGYSCVIINVSCCVPENVLVTTPPALLVREH